MTERERSTSRRDGTLNPHHPENTGVRRLAQAESLLAELIWDFDHAGGGGGRGTEAFIERIRRFLRESGQPMTILVGPYGSRRRVAVDLRPRDVDLEDTP
jgi:hypothetical protein